MRVLLSRMPALDATLIRFDTWWSGLSRRELVLVGGLAALLAALVLVFGVIKPIQAARAQALAEIRTYETLNARILAAGTLAPSAPRRTGAPATLAANSAASFGVQATPQAIPDGVRMTVENGTYDALLAWISDLSATTDLRVRTISVQRRAEPGRISASVDFAG